MPGSIFALGSTGTNQLIRQGATPITTSTELLQALGLEIESGPQLKLDLTELSPNEKKVYELLSVESLPRDDLISALGLQTGAANSLLGIMEIKGIIKESLGEIRLA